MPAAIAAVVVGSFVVPAIVGRPAPGGVHALALVAAAALTLHGLGVVLVARADRCLNLAQVQIGVLAGTLFALLVNGRPMVRAAAAVCRPCVGDPGPGLMAVNFVVALVVAVATGAGVGWLVARTVVRRLRAVSPVVVTVATVFVTRVLAGLGSQLDGVLLTEDQRATNEAAKAITAPVSARLRLGDVTLSLPDLALVALAVAGVVGLRWWLAGTDAGRDLRAAAADADRAATLGIDAARASTRAWLVAGTLSAAAGVLVVWSGGRGALGSDGLSTALLVRILVVAVAARMASLPLVAAAAVAIAFADGSATWMTASAAPLDGVLVVVVAGLLFAQRRTTTTGDRATGATWAAVRVPAAVPAVLAGLPELRRLRRLSAATVTVAVLALPWLLSPAQTGLAAVAAVVAVVGLSTLVVTGWAGQLSLGQVAFAAIGAAVAGTTHLPLPFALPLGAVAAGAVAAGIGTPSVRLRGMEPAAVTLALALTVSAVLLDPTSLGRLVGDPGGDGLPLTNLTDPRTSWYTAAVVAAVAAVAVARFRQSRLGRALVAARDDEATAATFGIDVVRARVAGFAVAGSLAGGAGVLLAHVQGAVAPESFTPDVGLAVFTTTVLGGLGGAAGPLLGSAAVGLLDVASASPAVVSLLVGAGGLGLLLAAPGGLLEVLVSGRDVLLRRVARRRRLAVPSIGATGVDAVAPIAERTVAALGPDPVDYALAGQWGLPAASRPEPTR